MLNIERTQEWIANGAQASDRVKHLIKMHQEIAKQEQATTDK
jgi:ribosomal protein S16